MNEMLEKEDNGGRYTKFMIMVQQVARIQH